jgi:hypothetical protein
MLIWRFNVNYGIDYMEINELAAFPGNWQEV